LPQLWRNVTSSSACPKRGWKAWMTWKVLPSLFDGGVSDD
jgi:hypothetical protein